MTSTWSDRVEAFAGKRRDAAVLAGVVAAVALVTMIMWTRRAPASIAPPATALQDAAPSAGSSPAPAATLLVHVSGRVRRPGLYALAPGARVADAIALAGGARRASYLNLLNLAELLHDGQKVEVGPHPRVPPPASSPGAVLVSLNSADALELESIPGIGPAKAAAIIQERDRRGGFAAVEDLLAVQGIGPATLEAIRPYVTL